MAVVEALGNMAGRLLSQPVQIPLVVGSAVYATVVVLVLLVQSAYPDLPKHPARRPHLRSGTR